MQTGEGKNLKANFINAMQAKILSGELKPGDRLPPERELAQQMGISRGSVNQGILDMERMGFLRIVPRKGTFVAEYVRRATPESLRLLQAHADAIYAAGEDEAAEAVYAYHKCLTEISGNAAYAMVFQSFEKMIRNLIREHYKNASELTRSLPKFTLLTEAVARRDAFEADRCILSVLEQASDYLNTHLKSREAGRGE